MAKNHALSLLIIVICLLAGCASQSTPPYTMLKARGIETKVWLEQDGQEIIADESGVYHLKPAPFVVAHEHQGDAGTPSLQAVATNNKTALQELLDWRDNNGNFAVLTGTVSAWDYHHLPYDNELDTEKGTIQGLVTLFEAEDDSNVDVQLLYREMEKNHRQPLLFVMANRYSIDWNVDTNEAQTVFTIDGMGGPNTFPSPAVYLLLTLSVTGEDDAYIYAADVSAMRLKFKAQP